MAELTANSEDARKKTPMLLTLLERREFLLAEMQEKLRAAREEVVLCTNKEILLYQESKSFEYPSQQHFFFGTIVRIKKYFCTRKASKVSTHSTKAFLLQKCRRSCVRRMRKWYSIYLLY